MATTIISSKQMPPGLSEFMVQVLDQMQEIKPKHIVIICVDESRDYYIHRYRSSYVDLQRMALELNNQGIMEMVDQNRDFIEDWENDEEDDFS